MVRAAVLKMKDPRQIIKDMEKLDEMGERCDVRISRHTDPVHDECGSLLFSLNFLPFLVLKKSIVESFFPPLRWTDFFFPVLWIKSSTPCSSPCWMRRFWGTRGRSCGRRLNASSVCTRERTLTPTRSYANWSWTMRPSEDSCLSTSTQSRLCFCLSGCQVFANACCLT